ncbi:MAG: hypothetical protein WCU80_00530 [Paludibacteraceae bacterium]
MAKTNRRTLKEYFAAGKKPDSSQFVDLIDSMLNIVDDGFIKTSEGGMTLSPLNGNRAGNVMEVRQDILDPDAAWRFSIDGKGSFFICPRNSDQPVISLFQDGSILIDPNLSSANVRQPNNVVVNGGVVAASYMGEKLDVPANGAWQDISAYDYACMAFRVVAKVKGKKGSGKYAMLEVSAMNCFGKHASIKKVGESWFGKRFNRIDFRWNEKKDEQGEPIFGLQVRSRSDYGEGHTISYYILDL